ncbi:MAG TPA: alpha/beta fold hydrolase [Candidatus Elarobacter sp.]|jgi:hypothetical protein
MDLRRAGRPSSAALLLVFFAAASLARGAGSPAFAATGADETITFVSADATLVGTLHRAPGPGAHPAIVLLSGTGPARRDGPSFRPLFEPFTAAGYSVFAYDKRGAGDSPGRFDPYQTVASLADDGVAAVHALQRLSGIDPRRVGVWGVSQGGWVGPLMAASSPDVAFVISVSASGATAGEVEMFQRGEQLRGRGFSADDARDVTAFRRVLWAYYGTGYGRDAAQAAYDKARTRPWFSALKLDAALGTPETIDPGLREFMRQMLYDPARTAERVTVPVLVVFGAKDSLAPVDDGVARLMLAYARGKNPHVEFAVFANGGHGLQLVSGESECHECFEKDLEAGRYVPVPGYIERMTAFLKSLR